MALGYLISDGMGESPTPSDYNFLVEQPTFTVSGASSQYAENGYRDGAYRYVGKVTAAAEIGESYITQDNFVDITKYNSLSIAGSCKTTSYGVGAKFYLEFSDSTVVELPITTTQATSALDRNIPDQIVDMSSYSGRARFRMSTYNGSGGFSDVGSFTLTKLTYVS